MGNVNALSYKMDELTALIRTQGCYRESSLLISLETWLISHVPDANVNLPDFTSLGLIVTWTLVGKVKVGVSFSMSMRWCNLGHLTMKAVRCCHNLELLAVSIRP